MFIGIEHIGFMAKDPEKLAIWYEKVLHFRRIFTTAEIPPIVFLAGEKTGIIEFIPYPEGMEVPVEKDKRLHLAIAVEDFDQALQHLQAEGVTFPDDPFDLFKGGKTVFFQDPEGNWLQVVYRPEPPWTL
jgi:catechol 2,3-dioxygenase-like lactoylglutathione lyase family enzyme